MAARSQRIMRAAVDMFQSRGYLGTTMDDIAAAAGVTKRTVYHHVGSKQNLLVEIHTAFVDEGLRRCAAIPADLPPVERLRRLLLEHISIVVRHRKDIAVFFEEAKHLDAESAESVIVRRDRYEHIFREAMADAQRSGELDDSLDTKVLTLLILGGLTDMYRWFQPRRDGSTESIIALVTRIIFEGIELSADSAGRAQPA